jgi:hypothetical protein
MGVRRSEPGKNSTANRCAIVPKARETREEAEDQKDLNKFVHVTAFIAGGDDFFTSQLFVAVKRVD